MNLTGGKEPQIAQRIADDSPQGHQDTKILQEPALRRDQVPCHVRGRGVKPLLQWGALRIFMRDFPPLTIRVCSDR